ncbi:MAG: catechol 2,3-dioxygenase-like lactoylglutathione lyase family enzyme [Yoonia sp.]|jgi:catechol 2,3-dioxygenase-like lactoylglutathione lyase family enzyme
MKLGSFSVSLNVKDIGASQAFYEKLGFAPFAGDPTQGWLILRNGDSLIGLFFGMIQADTMTFNPGWDQNAQNIDEFEDVRDIQKRLKADGIAFVTEADETTSGPTSFVVLDPDGNPILVDQHR